MKTPDAAPAKRGRGRPCKPFEKRGDYRHSSAEVAAIATIRTHYGLRSDAAAVELALLKAADDLRRCDEAAAK